MSWQNINSFHAIHFYVQQQKYDPSRQETRIRSPVTHKEKIPAFPDFAEAPLCSLLFSAFELQSPHNPALSLKAGKTGRPCHLRSEFHDIFGMPLNDYVYRHKSI